MNTATINKNFASQYKLHIFSLQESDLRYLVENVWSSQSALSAWEDIYDLVLVRWDRHSEWSPWNCCLLTKEEASAHEKLVDLSEVSITSVNTERLSFYLQNGIMVLTHL